MAASARRNIHRGINRPGVRRQESNNHRITFPGLRSIILQTRIAIPRCYVMRGHIECHSGILTAREDYHFVAELIYSY